jgi:sulfonate transport system permease protein
MVLGLLAWWAVALVRVAGKPLVATPWDAATALPGVLPTLGADLLATSGRAGLGLVLGVSAGLAIGLAAALVARAAPVVEGALDFARSIPPVVMLPLFLLALGYNDSARVATIAAGCAWIMALSVTTAATAPPSARREVLDLAGATRLRALAWTQPWESLPVLAVGLRASASTAVVVAVVTEMIAGTEHGIGSRIISAQIASDTTMLTLSVLAVGAVGYAANVALRSLESWATRLG